MIRPSSRASVCRLGAAGLAACGALLLTPPARPAAGAALRALEGWPRDLGRPVASASIAPVDLDRDGVPELAVGADSALYIFRADGSPYFGTTPQVGERLPGRIVGEIAATERFVLNPEFPDLESWIAASVEGDGVHLWDGRGAHVSEGVSPAPTTGPIFPAGVTAQPVIWYAVAGRSDGSLSFFPYEIVVTAGDWCRGSPIAAVATVNRTGIGGDEIVAVSEAGLVGVFRFIEDAPMAVGWPSEGVATGGGLAATRRRWVLSGDVDRADASTPDIVVADSSGTIHLLNVVGDELPGWPVTLGAALAAGPVLGDVDDDGRLEIVAVDVSGRAHLVRHTARERRGWPRSFEGGAGEYDSPPLVLDLDDAAGRDVLAHLPSGDLREPGEPGGWSLSDAPPAAGPVAVDLDRDGKLEIAAVDAAGRVHLVRTERAADRGEGEWRIPGYDIERRASFPSGRLPELRVPAELLPAASLACYPNPAPGDVLFVHYALGRPAEVSLDLFDMAGKRVASRPGTTFIGDDNTVEIPIGGLASGTYVLRIRAAGESGSVTLLEKVAVLR